MKRGVAIKKRNNTSPMSRRPDSPGLEGTQTAQVSLSDKLIETIRNLTSNKDLLTTRLAALNGEGLKTASIMEVAGMYRSLVSQVAVLYDTDDFQNIVAPYIQKRFEEIGSPSLTPGTIGSYIFGCYLSDYGLEHLSKFCTPICAASIRVPNRNRINMRCTEKVIWTDGGDTPVFILIDEDPNNSTNGKVFIPWVGDSSSFVGLTQGAIDEIKSLGVESVEIFGQLFNNKYIQLLAKKNLSEISVVERIRLRSVDYINNRNGGMTSEKISKVDLPKVAGGPAEKSNVNNTNETDKPTMKASGSSTDDSKKPTLEKKDTTTGIIVGVVAGVVLLFFFFMLFGSRNRR